MTEPYSEADTRRQVIDNQLRLAGWDLNDPTQVIRELDIDIAGRKLGAVHERPREPYTGHQFADYALQLRGQPAAVIEAKKTSRDAQVGQEQAKQYAENIQEIVGGPLPFILYTNGHDTFFWNKELYPPARVFGFPSRSDLEWMSEQRDSRRPLSVEAINTAIAGRDYQLAGLRTILEQIEARHRKFLMVMATGTGKTRTAVALVDVLMRAHWAKRVLFLVDRVALQEQALNAFKHHLPSTPRWPEAAGEPFDRNRRVYVTTYPSMLNLIEAGTTPSTWISPFFFDLIIADESHRSIYNIYSSVIKYFHGITLGLTATPRDHVAHDTFALFDCATHDPTFAYGFDEAITHDPPYLCDFEVLKVRSKFQVEGIRGPKLDEEQQEQLVIEGMDPDSIDFEGTELEHKVTNSGSNALIVREFMEECIKDPTGTLPGKSIIFACSKAHARRLQELFDSLYPEHRGNLARVIVSDDSRVYGKGGLLDQFKTQDFPRVAISVDLLDTGVDIHEVVNLVFAKPVYSYVKFWQMIGRGTRILDADPGARKPWCPTKDKFLIIDCWANFEYFDLHPKGREPGEQTAMPVRLFRARLDKLTAARTVRAEDVAAVTVQDLRGDIAALPANNVIVLERQKDLAAVRRDAFWPSLSDADLEYLRTTIAPILRAQSGVDGKALRFETDVIDYGTAMLRGNADAMRAFQDSIVEQVSELPLGVNLVAAQRELISAVQTAEWWVHVDDAMLRDLVARLGPLMRFRQEGRSGVVHLNLADITAVRERIVIGPDGRDLPIAAYRQRVEETVRSLLRSSPVLQRLQSGAEISDADVRALAESLKGEDPTIDEERLRKAYDARTASFVQLIRHVLGVQPIESWTTTVTREFDEFIAGHPAWTALQIRFLQTLRTFVLQRGRVERKDLVESPFTQIHPQGIRGVFSGPQLDEVLGLTAKLAA